MSDEIQTAGEQVETSVDSEVQPQENEEVSGDDLTVNIEETEEVVSE